MKVKVRTKVNKAVMIVLLVLLFIIIAGFSIGLIINAYVKVSAGKYILSMEEAGELSDVDCVLVLGCRVYSNKTASPMLSDRVNVGIDVFNTGVTNRILMSGDHGQDNYNEVGVMKRIATDAGIDSDCIFCDHAGFSTYESMYRAMEIFGVKKMIIVTQEYHLYRAIYIARALGIDAYGVAADKREYAGDIYREIREILARDKDVFTCIFKPEPTYLGPKLPIDGPGSITDG